MTRIAGFVRIARTRCPAIPVEAKLAAAGDVLAQLRPLHDPNADDFWVDQAAEMVVERLASGFEDPAEMRQLRLLADDLGHAIQQELDR